ncbi:hypothetical protein CDAR_21821 [Caerostris darwini]|uniref:Uncharacterized protein n=1 Tax=Caerostris darwini TaxID=1538125 RepID=A0AAV4TGI3_9ARAC|nr:hypothetical protein CDAR_21821 [Caerostris darwini]
MDLNEISLTHKKKNFAKTRNSEEVLCRILGTPIGAIKIRSAHFNPGFPLPPVFSSIARKPASDGSRDE